MLNSWINVLRFSDGLTGPFSVGHARRLASNLVSIFSAHLPTLKWLRPHDPWKSARGGRRPERAANRRPSAAAVRTDRAECGPSGTGPDARCRTVGRPAGLSCGRWPAVLRARLPARPSARPTRPSSPAISGGRASPHPDLGFRLDGDALKWGRKFLACGPGRGHASCPDF